MSLLHTVKICLYCNISMHCISFVMYRRWYICTYAIRWRAIQGRMQREKRKDEKLIEIQSFECISEWQYRTGEPWEQDNSPPDNSPRIITPSNNTPPPPTRTIPPPPPTNFVQFYFVGFVVLRSLVRLVVYFPCFRV